MWRFELLTSLALSLTTDCRSGHQNRLTSCQILSPFHHDDRCQNDQVGPHVRSYLIYDLFPIPEGLISAFEIVHSQIEFLYRPLHVLVSGYKDGCAKFYGLVGSVIMRMNRSAPFKEVSQS